MTKFFKKYDHFLNEGVLVDLSTIFVSALFGKSLFEYRKANLKLCVKGIDNILKKAYDEFNAKHINESNIYDDYDDYDVVIRYFEEYIETLDRVIIDLRNKKIDKIGAKKLVDLSKKLDRDFFPPEISDMLDQHEKDFNTLRLISKTTTDSMGTKPFAISASDIDKKASDLSLLREVLLDLARDPSDIEAETQAKTNAKDPFSVKTDEPAAGDVFGNDIEPVEKNIQITEVKPQAWSNGKKEALTNYLIEKYKGDINNYLVDIAKSKFNKPTAKARIGYNNELEERWKEYKNDIFEKWKSVYLAEKLHNLFETGIKMTTSKLYDVSKIDPNGTKRILENLPLIDASSLESGITKFSPDNFYMTPIHSHTNKLTTHCLIFYIPDGQEQIVDDSALWALPIAKVKFNNFKYKVEQFFLDDNNNQILTYPLFLVTNTKANLTIIGKDTLLVKVTPNENNMLDVRHIRVDDPEDARKDNHLYIVSPVFKLLSSEMKDKFKIDKGNLKITTYPKDKKDIESYFFRQKRTKKTT